MKETILETPIFAYEAARSTWFNLQFHLFMLAQSPLPGASQFMPKINRKIAGEIQREIFKLLKADANNIANGIYPLSVLKPESFQEHLRRIPSLITDGLSMYWRRRKGRTTAFKEHAKNLSHDLPKYYQRNFHFQTDGYLSENSAKLYEHQVEMLFGGGADAMRRLIIKPLKEKFGDTDGKGLKFLEIGAGTGRATRFVHLAFPKAKIVAVDLSGPYLKEAAKKLSDLDHISFVQGDGAKLPFHDKHFDAAYSIFLFHELPMEARREVITEMMRVLKPDGYYGLVDSLQLGDVPKFDELLKKFPEDYHEPFYRNYIENPIQNILKSSGLKAVEVDTGLFSKVCSAIK